ncbi:hypothetical protein LXL04_030745 [Taraxacum kok-saghyz]
MSMETRERLSYPVNMLDLSGIVNREQREDGLDLLEVVVNVGSSVKSPLSDEVVGKSDESYFEEESSCLLKSFSNRPAMAFIIFFGDLGVLELCLGLCMSSRCSSLLIIGGNGKSWPLPWRESARRIFPEIKFKYLKLKS